MTKILKLHYKALNYNAKPHLNNKISKIKRNVLLGGRTLERSHSSQCLKGVKYKFQRQ